MRATIGFAKKEKTRSVNVYICVCIYVHIYVYGYVHALLAYVHDDPAWTNLRVIGMTLCLSRRFNTELWRAPSRGRQLSRTRVPVSLCV